MGTLLRLAVQKTGRLSEDSLSLLAECGIDIPGVGKGGRLKAACTNFPMEVLFLRDDDIPGYVADGVAHAGIVGENVVAESEYQVSIVDRLGFGRCRLSLAVPRGSPYRETADLAGKRIATSYPRLLAAHLREVGVSAHLHTISGSVEIAPSIGLADAICDLVSSGSTLVTNGLVEIGTVFRSEAVLVCTPNREALGDAASPLEKLCFRFRAVQRARRSKYILLNAPDTALAEVTRLLPGAKSPTIVPLLEPGWSSVQSVIEEDAFWEVIDRLREVGAQGILVMPIEKMIN